jgi:hypothetical protein
MRGMATVRTNWFPELLAGISWLQSTGARKPADRSLFIKLIVGLFKGSITFESYAKDFGDKRKCTAGVFTRTVA